MAYEPTNWKSGDVVTSAKLNKMENGIAGAEPLVFGYTSYDVYEGKGSLDLTWQEIHDAMTSGRLVMALYKMEEVVSLNIVEFCGVDGSDYIVTIGHDVFRASSPDGYPSNEGGSE